MPLTVMTYNIRHGENMRREYALEGIAAVISDLDPDLVALQEVDRLWGDRSRSDDQPARLADLTGLTPHFAPALQRDAGQSGQYGNLILSRFPLSECVAVPLPQLDDTSEPRSVAAALVDAEGTPVRLYSTHLQHTSAAERAVQVRSLLDLITQHPEPTILAGDFNATPDQEELGPLFTALADAWSAHTTDPGHTIRSDNPTKRIDYLFLSPHWQVVDARVVATLASDHLPVLARLEPQPAR